MAPTGAENFWNLRGQRIGFRDDDSLRTPEGLEIARFYEKELYGPDGRYMGEVVEEGRLARKNTSCGKTRDKFLSTHHKTNFDLVISDQPARALPVGFNDFPHPDEA